MALKSLRSQSHAVADMITSHVRDFSENRSVNCIVYAKIGERFVDQFRLNDSGEPEVGLRGENKDVEFFKPSDLNLRECLVVKEAIEDNADSLCYQKVTGAINHQTEMANKTADVLKQYFSLAYKSGVPEVMFKNPFLLGDQKVIGFSFDANKPYDGEYNMLVEGKQSRWIWSYSGQALEVIYSNVSKELKEILAQRQKKGSNIRVCNL